jgi:MFS family permease
VTTIKFIFNKLTAALAYEDFRHMWLANASAQAAAWALIVTRGWLVYDQTGSTLSVGLTTFAAMGPMVIIPPLAGVLADRFDRRTVLAWTYAVNLGHNLVLASLALAGILDFWMILVLSLVNGVGRAVQMPTSQALAANLVPREKLVNALSLTASTQHGSRLIGPGLSTPLLSLFGAGAAFMLCTVFYAVGLIEVLRIKTKSRGIELSKQAGQSYFSNFKEGLGYVGQQPVIRFVILIAFFHCGLTMAFETLLPGFSRSNLVHNHDGSVDATGFGTLMMGVGAGSLVGSLAIAGIDSAKTRGTIYLLTGILSGLGLVMLAFTTTLWVALIAAVIMGGGQSAFMTMGQAITQAMAEDEYRGRVASINTFMLGGAMSIMNLTNGALGGVFTPGFLIAANGVAFVFIMMVSAFALTGRRVYGSGISVNMPAAPAAAA